MTSVGAANENQHSHDRGDHYSGTDAQDAVLSSYVSRVQVFHADEANGVLRTSASHLIRGSDPRTDVSDEVSVDPVDYACIDVSHLEQRWNIGVSGTAIDPEIPPQISEP